jgi:hypothetical protein
MLAPPRPPAHDQLEALIREARARQRKRWLGAVAVIAVLAGAALAVDSIVPSRSSNTAPSEGGPSVAVKSGNACGIRVENTRIVDSGGRTLYREPGNWTPSYPHPAVVRCSGSTAWVVWDNGAAMNQEGYVGARSTDADRTWRLVFAEAYFVNAPHQLDSYLGPWTLHGPRAAYFTGWCPVCGVRPPYGSVSLSVTKDEGKTFHHYEIPARNGYQPIRIRVSGREVAIMAKGFVHQVWRRKTVALRVT